MKPTTKLILSVFIALSLTATAAEPRFVATKPSSVKMESSEVTIKGTSSLHEWEMAGSTINGVVEADLDAWKTPGERPAKVAVTIPVTSIRSEHSKMDSLMQDALKAKANRDIKYEISKATLTKVMGDSFVVRTTGKLSIAGVTREVIMDVTATRLSETRYVLTGQTVIRMPDYGVKPPTAMLGTIKTGPEVTVIFRWIVGRI